MGRRVVLVIAVALGIAGSASGKVIYVDANAPGANDGTSWEDAYNFLRDALADANLADEPVEIWVARGVYTPDSNSAVPDGTGDRKATFQLINGVSLMGGYAGYGAPDANERDAGLFETILSGDLERNDDGSGYYDFDNAHHVVMGSGTDGTGVMDGFTATGGRGTYGGGMYNYEGSPTVANCIFSGNRCDDGGSGIYNDSNSNPTLRNCTFTENTIDSGNGAGMYNGSYSSPLLTNCTFSKNTIASGAGAGMYNDSNSSPILTNCTFVENRIETGGGAGMYNGTNSSPTLANCTFAENMTDNGGGAGTYNDSNSNPVLTGCNFNRNEAEHYGGGIFDSLNSSANVTDCTFTENSAYVGGAMYTGTGTPTVMNCRFNQNSSENDGGAISGGGMFTGCTFTLNSARSGGALASGGDAVLTGCVFLANTAEWYGGGIRSGFDTVVTVTDCFFGENSTDHGGGALMNEGDSTVTYCIFNDNSADNGGAIQNRRDLTIAHCTLSENSAQSGGGGLFNSSVWTAEAMMINCLFRKNAAQTGAGGGVLNYRTATLTNCTLRGNLALNSIRAAGMHNYHETDVKMTDCILWDNRNEDGEDQSAQIRFARAPWEINYCCVEGWTGSLGGTGNFADDPLFASGPLGDCYLSQIVAGQAIQSPCVDAGSNNAFDLGMDVYTTRIDIIADVGTVDIGHHYALGCPLGDLDGSCDVDMVDFAMFAALWQENDCSEGNEWCNGADLFPNSPDGTVDALDLTVFADNWLAGK